ncbi:AraC family transcriptional regulator [Hydrogenophaga electricum]|uniref:Transcriptional regulator n=1 Tax=Hydrogenophaga electricum TaxID=1230953 RepID=A0ABQ6C938_9BURK|nr:AraC family transcriptional regulator [Hydrogenophaga electricum]GLS16162.1 transcriptional regulator [Hydrogenophaga electricum]
MHATPDRLSVRQYGAPAGSHDHEHSQILLGLEGWLELDVQGHGHRIGAGQGLVIAPGEHHDFESRAGARCLVLDSHDPAWLGLASTRPSAHTVSLARYLAQACIANLPRTRLLGPALLLEAWAPHRSARPPELRRAIDWGILRAWAQQHLHAELRVADLAAQVHLSPAQFGARCLQEQGQSPMAWLRGLRHQQARRLRAEGWSVAAVARQCGYRSPSALTAALRRADT